MFWSLSAEVDDDDEEEAEDVPEISDVRATTIQRQQLQEEFRAIMREKFISGNDAQFDYRCVTAYIHVWLWKKWKIEEFFC